MRQIHGRELIVSDFEASIQHHMPHLGLWRGMACENPYLAYPFGTKILLYSKAEKVDCYDSLFINVRSISTI